MKFLALLLPACLSPGSPSPPCEALCAASTDRFGVCLDERDETWEDAGYLSSSDYQESCHTWAWELHILARSAPDSKEAERDLDSFCEAQRALVEATSTDCDAFLALDWETEPWLQ